MAEHTLKVDPAYFDPLADGAKPFCVRRNDRGFQRGDTVWLREWAPGLRGHAFTGRDLRRTITYVYSGDPRWPGVHPGWVVLGLGPTEETDRPTSRVVPAGTQVTVTSTGNIGNWQPSRSRVQQPTTAPAPARFP